MIIKCLKRAKNKHGVITSYLVCDAFGNKRVLPPEQLKKLMSTNQVTCTNLKLTSDGRLIGMKEKTASPAVSAATILSPEDEQKRLLELYRKYQNVLNRHVMMGTPIAADAEYRVVDNKVQLVRVLRQEGTFEIPEFVSEICPGAFSRFKSLKVLNKSAVTRMTQVFTGNFNRSMFCPVLDLSEFDTSRVTDMSNMFNGLTVRELDLSHFDTSHVVNMKNMFFGCRNLERLDLRSFNTSRVTNMSGMFLECGGLISVNLSSFDTSNVTDMSAMFCCCPSLKRLDLRNFNTSKVTSMLFMFGLGDEDGNRGAYYEDTSNYLEYVNLSSFDTSNVTSMGYMFLNCDHLEYLDIRHFKTAKCRDFERMFAGCAMLRNVDFSHFDLRSAMYTESMFSDVKYRDTFKLNKSFSKHPDIFKKVIEHCHEDEEEPADDDEDNNIFDADYYHDTKYDDD